jgi:magnesium chelatase subunit D
LALTIRSEDLMLRDRQRRAGCLFVLVVDASGSMAKNRVREAKSAAIGLLRQAYRTRDAVALLGCRGPRAYLLLPPTTAPARARRCLERLPTGGGTPLGSAVLGVLELARRERLTATQRPIVSVFLTDGRANVPVTAGNVAESELEALATDYRRAQITTLVVDTRPAHDRRPFARSLASVLGADYLRLPQVRASELQELLARQRPARS